MKHITAYRTILSAIIMATLIASPIRATTISQDFEGSSLGSTTPPSGWSYIDVYPTKNDQYVTTNGYSGLGGEIWAYNNANSDQYPGAYVVNNGGLAFNATNAISGSFNFRLMSTDSARSSLFILGDIGDGITVTDSGEYIGLYLKTTSGPNKGGIINGADTRLVMFNANMAGDHWYDVAFTWTPTNGTTGNFSATGTDLDGSSDWSVSYNGFTFTSEIVFFGFGAADYWNHAVPSRFDNISITGTIIPESPAVPPEVSSITNNVSDGPVETYNPITYTVTFNEAMDDTTITTNSFTNSAASAATVTFDSVSGSSAEYDVVVTPSTAGDIVLQASSNVTDLSGNLMTNNVDDTTTITVTANDPTVTNITSDADGTTPDIGYPITYTVAFSETMDAGTVTTNEFVNSAGSPATLSIDSVSPATDTDVFTVVVTPSTAGDLVLQVSSNVTDLAGNLMTNNVDDATTISVVVAPPEVSSIASDKDGETSVDINLPIAYTVTFNEVIDASTVAVGDFVNADGSGATITVDSVSPATDTNVFTVVVTPTAAGNGNLTLRLSSGGVSDLTATATDQDWNDATTISVVVTPPTVSSITSDKDDGAEVDLPVTYTVTFSEAMDAATVETNDFTNAVAGAAITVDSVSPATDTNVFTVVVTPSTAGDLQLRVKSGSVADLSGNATTTDYDDDTTITVTADTTPPEVSSFSDDTSPNAVAVDGTVTYTVTFNEPIDGTTVETTDFANASNATINVTSVSPATDTNVFTVAVSPISTGGLKLRLLADKVVDLSGNTNDVAFTDDTVITVVSSSDQDGTWTNDANGNWGDLLNWQDNLIADGANYTATFGDVITADRTITLDSARTIGNISFTDTSHHLTISGGNTLTLDATSGTPEINVADEELSLNCVIAGTNGLTKTGNGILYLGNGVVNTYSGGTFLNAGQLILHADSPIGTGPLTLSGGTVRPNRNDNPQITNSVIVPPGASAEINCINQYYDIYISGPLSGSGGLAVLSTDNGQGTTTFSSDANSFSGALQVGDAGDRTTLTLNSLGDGANPLTLYGAAIVNIGSGSAFSLLLNSRQIELAGTTTGATINNNNGSATVTVNTDLKITGVGNKTFTLGGGNTGDNTFAGAITNGPSGSVISLTKAGNGKWILSGENTYSGVTTVNAGTLVIQGRYTLSDSGTLNIAGGKVEISTVERIDNLQFAGTPQATGTWGSTSSGADNQNDTYFTGTGILYVGVDLPATGSVFRFK